MDVSLMLCWCRLYVNVAIAEALPLASQETSAAFDRIRAPVLVGA